MSSGKGQPRYAEFVKLLRNEHESIFVNVTSMLDIGAEAGDFDALLISELMPRLERFYAVEANQDLCERLEKNIRNIDQRNIQISNGMMQLYDGPGEPVDIVVMVAVAYYIPHQRAMVKDALSWLKPQGHLVMIHWSEGIPVQKSGGDRGVPTSSHHSVSFDGAPLLKELGLKYQEHKKTVPFDVTKDQLEMPQDRALTELEEKQFYQSLESHCTKQGERLFMDMSYSVLVVPKSQ